MEWLKDNIGTIIAGAVVLCAVIGIVVYLIKRKKKGKCLGCDCCDKCSSSSGCESKKPKSD